MQDLRKGDIVIQKVGNGYVLSVVRSLGDEIERHVAKDGDGGTDLVNVLRQLLVKNVMTG